MWTVPLAEEPFQFCISCSDNKKGAVLNGMCKDVVRMKLPVSDEYRDCPAAWGVPVDQLI